MNVGANLPIDISQTGRGLKELDQFPVPHEVIQRIWQVTGEENTSGRDLARAVDGEPAVVNRLIGLLFIQGEPVDSAEEAVLQATITFGFTRVRNLALEALLYDTLIHSDTTPWFGPTPFWRHALAVAHLAHLIAEALLWDNPQEAWLAGLVHDLGKPLLHHLAPLSYDDLLAIPSRSDEEMVIRERHLMGFSHDDMGAYLLDRWGFSRRIVTGVRGHHRLDMSLNLDDGDLKLAAIVQLADFLAWVQGYGSMTGGRIPALSPHLERIVDIRDINLAQLNLSTDPLMQEAMSYHGMPLPSSNEGQKRLMEASLRLARSNSVLQASTRELRYAPLPPSYRESLLAPHQSLCQKEIFNQTLKAIHREFHFKGVILFGMDAEQRELEISHWKGDLTCRQPPNLLKIPLTQQESGFRTVLREGHGRIIRGESPVEKRVLRFLGISELGIVPISGTQRSHGVVAVWNPEGRPLEKHTLLGVTNVVGELGLALEHARLHQKVSEQADRDALTGLYNRGRVDRLLAQLVQENRKEITPFSIVIVDIDHFKLFNDRFGHPEGDRVLKVVAGLLQKHTRMNGLVARLGGEEFIIVLERTGHIAALRYAERLRKGVAKTGLLLGKRYKGQNLTISLGVAQYEPYMTNASELMKKADVALYAAKEGGRNRVVGAVPKPGPY
ncbi:MAG: diguanylate cyclase [Magnetococcales bacterium]|nr:diguanylate cyclase [Magnetococcales bacterium]